MNWIIQGVVPATWVVFTEEGQIVASGFALNRKRARRDIREALEMYG